MPDPNEGKTGTDEQAKELATLKSQVAELAAAKAALEKKVSDQEGSFLTPEYLDFLESKRGAGKQASSQDEEPDYDRMVGSELVKRMRTERDKAVAELREAHEKQLNDLQDRFQRTAAYYDLELAKVKVPGFEKALGDVETRKKLAEISRENPTWNTARVFKQFQIEKKLEEEEVAEKKATEKKSSLEATLLAIGEKGGLPQQSSAPAKLTAQQAAEKAWELTQAAEGE